MYFNYLPTLVYTLDHAATGQVVTDVVRRVILQEKLKEKGALYDQYDIKEGETPEIVANRFYRDPQLHWIILHTNEILDARYEWPMSDLALYEFVENKYGEGNVYAEHHIEYTINEGTDFEKTIIDDTNVPVTSQNSISNYDYELRLNEGKRRIRVLKSKYVPAVVEELQKLVNL